MPLCGYETGGPPVLKVSVVPGREGQPRACGMHASGLPAQPTGR